MTTIEAITIEADDPEAAARFWRDALGLQHVRVRPSQEPSQGFRGWTLSLVSAQPAAVDALFAAARDAGATVLQEPKKSLWGYGGSVQAPDGTVLTLASQSKKDTGTAERPFEQVVVQLGVADVGASKRAYAEHGIATGKSFGSRYAELDTTPVTVSLNARKALAKAAGAGPDGSGSHRLAIHADAGAFVDPDGFVWE